jgi:hypothetical protein
MTTGHRKASDHASEHDHGSKSGEHGLESPCCMTLLGHPGYRLAAPVLEQQWPCGSHS